MSNWSSKGPCGCRFSFQPSKNRPDPNQVCSCLIGWLVGWSISVVFLLGWNENLQPRGPLLDQFDTTVLIDGWMDGLFVFVVRSSPVWWPSSSVTWWRLTSCLQEPSRLLWMVSSHWSKTWHHFELWLDEDWTKWRTEGGGGGTSWSNSVFCPLVSQMSLCGQSFSRATSRISRRYFRSLTTT